MVPISHHLLLTNRRAVKTTAWYSIITSHCLSHTCTRIRTISCPFSPPRMMVWPADGVATSERHWGVSTRSPSAASLTPACCVCTCNTHLGQLRWTTPPVTGGRYTPRSLAVVRVRRTCGLRCVRLRPRVSRVWCCVTNIWTYSREGGGISGYRCHSFTRTADSVQSSIKPFLVLIDLLNRLWLISRIVDMNNGCLSPSSRLALYTSLHVLQPLPPAARYLSIYSHVTLLVLASALFLFAYSNSLLQWQCSQRGYVVCL